MPEPRLTRRTVLGGGLAGALAFPMINRGNFAFAAAPGRTYSARAIKMLVRIFVSTNCKEQKAEVVFDPGEGTLVPCLFKVITCS